MPKKNEQDRLTGCFRLSVFVLMLNVFSFLLPFLVWCFSSESECPRIRLLLFCCCFCIVCGIYNIKIGPLSIDMLISADLCSKCLNKNHDCSHWTSFTLTHLNVLTSFTLTTIKHANKWLSAIEWWTLFGVDFFFFYNLPNSSEQKQRKKKVV